MFLCASSWLCESLDFFFFFNFWFSNRKWEKVQSCIDQDSYLNIFTDPVIFFFLIPCWTERETCMVFFPFRNAEFIWSRLCLHIFLGVHTSMGLHNNMALPVRCHTLWGCHVSCGLRFGESTSSSSILWMVMPKIPNLELVIYPSPWTHKRITTSSLLRVGIKP